jgi:hypothetical protein
MNNKDLEISQKLLAIAEDKDVEFYDDGKWEINKELASFALDWLYENIDEIRIKPDPNFWIGGTVNWSQKVGNNKAIGGQFIVKIELDKETKTPINVEICND